MKINIENGKTYITELKDFSLEQTLECGQCFNFERIGEKEEYVVIAMDRLLHISQENETIILHNVNEEDINKWIYYFDLERDYGAIKTQIIKNAPELKSAINDKWGVRILNQEFSETLMSFIISQNKQIPHIKQIVRMISEEYGTKIGSINGKDYYSFPDVDTLDSIGMEGYQRCKTGFRAKYLVNAAGKMKSGLCVESFRDMEYEKALELLKEIKGVGDKVANCVLLFSLGYRSAFPVDVWIKRVMEDVYFKEDTDSATIMRFAKERFGEYGGYAQQYLFFYGRENAKKQKTRK